MARVLRGDVVWADMSPGVGHERAGFPLVLELESLDVGKPAWVEIGQVRTLSTRRLGKKLGRLAPEEIQRLIEGLSEILSA